MFYVLFAVLLLDLDFGIQHFITGAQPKAGTGHKMQSVPIVFERCEGYIADLLLEVLAVSLQAAQVLFMNHTRNTIWRRIIRVCIGFSTRYP